jgi:AsmA protein
MKALRWSLGILAALVLLIVLAALIATELINPNEYRGEAERLVSRYTGRPFVIEGPLRLGWYPWLTLGVGAARLGNPPGMRGPDLIAWRSARVPVRLLPLLLHQRIELGTIRVSGADIHLWRNAQGVGNWQHLLVSSPASGSASSPAPSIGGLILDDATLEFAAASGTVRLRRWQLQMGALRPGQPFSLRTRFILQAPKLPPAGVPIHFAARDLRAQSAPLDLAAPHWTLTVASATVSGALQFAEVGSQPRASGVMALTVPSLRGLIGEWGLKMRLPKDPAALGALSLSGRWRLQGGALRIEPLTARLDATTLTGWAQRSGGAAASWTFDLHANRINFSTYLPPARKHPKSLKLPLAMLRTLRAQGTLTVSRATYGHTSMRDVQLQVH